MIFNEIFLRKYYIKFLYLKQEFFEIFQFFEINPKQSQ